ncbi:MAG: GTP-binding protein, partial [Spirochaetales bacterium]|nr:GTP-binding protein [Spirochaetales bacterium]
MNVIGTAGHVDHGKTRLIQALTGIDTDRLPEEKARGLTIDLGFAHFEDSSGKKIGVIDVPGHERFIRNMVAGAWGVDCALLVVAADEGWMRQSNDHARVLACLKIKQLIVVVSKSDLVDAGAASDVEQDALIRCSEMGDWELSSIIVSVETLDNIDTLKSLIEERLLRLKKAAPVPPFMYVDRVFSVKGSGTVVTGSLMGGQIAKNTQVRILPGSETGRIRSIQSYYQDMDTAYPV